MQRLVVWSNIGKWLRLIARLAPLKPMPYGFSNMTNYRETGFSLIDTLLGASTNCLAKIIGEDDPLLAHLPWWNSEKRSAASGEISPERTAQFFATCFELLNLVEETVASHIRSQRRSEQGLVALRGLWAEALKEGFSQLGDAPDAEAQILEKLRDATVEPVLTAHPTEAKRPTVRERHRELYNALSALARSGPGTQEATRATKKLHLALETLWFTGELHTTRPTIDSELRNIIFYLREVFPAALADGDRALDEAWTALGYDPEALYRERAFPILSYGTWVGGDRDGHPLVTPEVTTQTFATLASHARELYRRGIHKAAKQLPLSPPFATLPAALAERRDALATEFPESAPALIERNRDEPWRQLLYLIREKNDHLPNDRGYPTAAALHDDIVLIETALADAGITMAARQCIRPLRRTIDTFGYHLAKLDIRQNSAMHDRALAEILTAVGRAADADSYAAMNPDARAEFLLAELRSEAPLLAPASLKHFAIHFAAVGEATSTVLGALHAVAKQIETCGCEGLNSLIVSMSRHAADLLLVHLLAREAGLATYREGYWCSPLPVCPLFEQFGDLEAAAAIMDTYLATTPAKLSHKRSARGRTLAPVMVGYSDSNKDAGILASAYALQKSELETTATGVKHGVGIEFFHGRGGTVSRGAGPTKWFLRSLPAGSVSPSLRLTEQGESIPHKYANPESARHHLESLLAGTFLASTRDAEIPPSQTTALTTDLLKQLATLGRQGYRTLLDAPGFIEFYRHATPIDALEHGTFGSRPSRRTGTNSLDDLRAIPWVFSWTQSRFYLPGWFGTGKALQTLASDSATFTKLHDLIASGNAPTLNYLFNNIETNMVSASTELMHAYAELVPDTALRDRFMSLVLTDFDQTKTHLAELLGGSFDTRRPRMGHTLQMRADLLHRLHLQQVDLLRSWRAGDEVLDTLLLNINAVASGLRTTG
ncbi:MAG: phosphoenolpyruvate carboxylase [Verrucomicrobiales bacterium]